MRTLGRYVRWIRRLGPGLVTGAADDDPAGVATYSQVGSRFGYQLLWTMPLTYPLMAAVQMLSARVGMVTGQGFAGSLRHYPRWVLLLAVALVSVANVINIGADLAAMGATAALVLPGPAFAYALLLGGVSAFLQVRVPYRRYASYLKVLTLILLAYVATAFVVAVDWSAVARATFLPSFPATPEGFAAVIAVLGTTISPYLFFWQASQEVEERKRRHEPTALAKKPGGAETEFRRDRVDTLVGMGLSNLVAFFVILTVAATLHANGITHIETAEQAAEALRPLAGDFAFTLFALGIVGTGLLAIPVLAGSTAFAVSEAFGWDAGLERKPGNARRFYLLIVGSMTLGAGILLLDVNPIDALYVSAIVNGLAAPPLIVLLALAAGNPKVMGKLPAGLPLRVLGWATALVMAAAALGLALSSL